ncbi:IclR family transcriptional regulator [Bordetella pertussis]
MLNALDVLEAVGKSESDIALSAVARNVGVSKSGVFRILSTFESRGYAEKGPGGGWRLGPRIIELGVGVPQRTLLTTAAPLMEALTKETLESTYLSVRDGFSMITLHTLEPDQTIRVHLPVGARTPANCTVSGLAVLANMDEQELLAMLPDELEGTAPASIVDRARLMEELRIIRERGYAAFLGHGGRIQGRGRTDLRCHRTGRGKPGDFRAEQPAFRLAVARTGTKSAKGGAANIQATRLCRPVVRCRGCRAGGPGAGGGAFPSQFVRGPA